jgi:hypothetical protein
MISIHQDCEKHPQEHQEHPQEHRQQGPERCLYQLQE